MWTRFNRILWWLLCGPFIGAYYLFVFAACVFSLPLVLLIMWIEKYRPVRTLQDIHDDYYGRL